MPEEVTLSKNKPLSRLNSFSSLVADSSLTETIPEKQWVGGIEVIKEEYRNGKYFIASSYDPRSSSIILAEKLKNFTPPKPDRKWEQKNWMQIFWYGISLPWWNWGGKVLPMIAKKLKLLPLAVTSNEKNGKFNMPITALGQKQQWVLERQFKFLNKKNVHNKNISNEWKILLKKYFPTNQITSNNFRVILKCDNQTQQKILAAAKQHKYHLRDWDGCPIAPADADLNAFGYKSEQCQMAEKYSKQKMD